MAATRKSAMWLGILRREFSAAAGRVEPGEQASMTSSTAAGKTRRKKNLAEVAQFLPNWGLGAKLAKGHWQPGVFYQLTRLQLGKDGRHGTAWGVFHNSGSPKTGVEERIGGANKRVWKYLREEDNH